MQKQKTQKQLNPTNLKDAIQIIDILTKDIQMTREKGTIFNIALKTLNDLVISSGAK